MKQLLFIGAFVLCSKYTFSQDTIVLINNEIVIAKILEVAPTTIKYKRFDMQDGPDYIQDNNNVKKIIYKNGITETVPHYAPAPMLFSPKPLYVPNAKFTLSGKHFTYNSKAVSENQMYRIIISVHDQELNKIIRKSKKNKIFKIVSLAGIPLALYSAQYGFYGWAGDNPFFQIGSVVMGAGAVACLTTGIICTVKHKKLKRKAVQLFNEKY